MTFLSAALCALLTLVACGSEGPATPTESPDATASNLNVMDRYAQLKDGFGQARALYRLDATPQNLEALKQAAEAYKTFVRAREAALEPLFKAEALALQPQPVVQPQPAGKALAVTTFPSPDVPKAIPDQGTATSALTIGPSGTINDLDVNLDITHTFDGDLDISITSPANTTVLLSNQNGSVGANYTNTTFDDEAGTPIGAGAPPYTGSFIPDQALSAFDGEDIQGLWTLTIVDNLPFDIGTLNSWSLTIDFVSDADNDGVLDQDDVCPGTVIPESVPTNRLEVNRWALVDGDVDFDTTSPQGQGPNRSYNTTDTGGCSCEQIIAALGLGEGHAMGGCSISAMDDWLAELE